MSTGYGIRMPEHDASALINVIRRLRPVVVVDESHNAESQLSVEMMKNLNPSTMGGRSPGEALNKSPPRRVRCANRP